MGNVAPDAFAGWDVYPHNLSLSALDIDAGRYHERLKHDAQRLFIPPGAKSSLRMLGLNTQQGRTGFPNQTVVESPEQLLQCLDEAPSTQVWFIDQLFSWDQLQISEEVFRKLLTSLKVHPAFLDVVHVFGEKVTAVEESFAVLFTSSVPDVIASRDCGHEITYNFKYVARHGRDNLRDPFSVRETGVYQKFRSSSIESTWVLLNPSEMLSNRVATAFATPEAAHPVGQFSCHILVLSCLLEDWRDYVNYLESEFSEMMDRGFLSNVETSARQGTIDADLNGIRKLQIMIDKYKRLTHLLDLDRRICKRLKAFFDLMHLPSPQEQGRMFDHCDSMIENCIFRCETHIAQLVSLVSRAEGVGSMIEHILNVRTARTSHGMNSAMHALSEQGAEENKLIRQLTLQSTDDTSSMKVVALVSAVFLPANFVATFFGSNFFDFEDQGQTHTLIVASNVWIYIVTALAFSALTVAFWYWWYSRTRWNRKRFNEPEHAA